MQGASANQGTETQGMLCAGDESRVELVRVGYDIQSTQKKMSEAGLPHALIERLSYGL